MRHLLISVLALSACSPSEPGSDIVWKDARGEVVGPDLLHVDADGIIWSIDPETGRAVPAVLDSTPYSTDSACGFVGRFAAAPPLPRYAFRIGDGGYLTRPDDLATAPVSFNSLRLSDGGCVDVEPSLNTVGVPRSSLRTVRPPPELAWSPPLHAELQ